MMKKVIFIGGTSYSGSTFFDMILANDDKGFSCGEVAALFHPFRKHHLDPPCGCMDKNCQIWELVKKNGRKNLYDTIFNNQNASFIVDSSKMVPWLHRNSKKLQKKGYDVYHLLIWKTPFEIANSFNKRKRNNDWKKKWTRYHQRYLTYIKDFKSIKYKDFVDDEEILKSVCDYTGIDYNAGKKSYWKRNQHTLFGNDSARINSGENEVIERLKNITGQSEEQLKDKGSKIYYDKIENNTMQEIASQFSNKKVNSQILEILEKTSIKNNSVNNIPFQKVKYNFLQKISYFIFYNTFLIISGITYFLYYKLGIKLAIQKYSK